eukprot:1749688-Pyramimonas_sp.AAC.1
MVRCGTGAEVDRTAVGAAGGRADGRVPEGGAAGRAQEASRGDRPPGGALLVSRKEQSIKFDSTNKA